MRSATCSASNDGRTAQKRLFQEGSDVPEMRADKIREKVAWLRRQIQYVKDVAAQLECNVQAAVDTDHQGEIRQSRSSASTRYGMPRDRFFT